MSSHGDTQGEQEVCAPVCTSVRQSLTTLLSTAVTNAEMVLLLRDSVQSMNLLRTDKILTCHVTMLSAHTCQQ